MSKISIFILLIIPVSTFGQSVQLQPTWASLRTIQKQWIKLERDSSGYLIYAPCDGSTPRININNGYVTIHWSIDSPMTLSIDKLTRIKGNKKFYMSAIDENCKAEINVEIIDAKRKLVLWKYILSCNGEKSQDVEKWVMTPIEFKKDFRFVNNPCPNQKIREKEFLPVEF